MKITEIKIYPLSYEGKNSWLSLPSNPSILPKATVGMDIEFSGHWLPQSCVRSLVERTFLR